MQLIMNLPKLTMEKYFRLWTLMSLLLITPFFLFAQEAKDMADDAMDGAKEKVQPYQNWEAGLFLGGAAYLGDLNEEDKNGKNTFNFPAFGLNINRNFSENFALRANLAFAQISSDETEFDDGPHQRRGWAFKNSLVELSLVGQYELFGKRRYSNNGAFKKTISPYIFGGIGLAFGKPEADNATTEALAQFDDSEGSRVAFPLGLGLKFDLSRKIALGIEGGVRATLSDELDGISQFPSSGVETDNEDWYGTVGVNLTFRLGEKDTDKDGIADIDDKCPTVAGIAEMDGCPDRDNDGIMDSADACPDTYGQKVLKGCPDTDGDGIADQNDKCPDTPGMRRFEGCPDTDGDDVIDSEDVCPTVAGLAKFSGCPDTDGDGIVDSEDKCPSLAGIAAAGGCPDSDGDGILDADDKCPNKAGTAAFAGCPDSDGDGIGDAEDKCPTLAGIASNDGCPAIARVDQKVLDDAMRNVRFETGSAKLTSASQGILNQIAEVVNRYPGYGLTMSGYTDNVGNDFTNQQLSEKRAASCMNYLAGKGISRSLMSSAGYGEARPIATNSTAAGRRLNRRVEFQLVRK